MAQTGLSLEETLAAATSVVAEVMRERELGRVAEGAIADLVLLDMNLVSPGQLDGLRDRVIRVWQGGRLVHQR